MSNQLIKERKEKLEELRTITNPYPQIFNQKNQIQEIIDEFNHFKAEEKSSKIFTIAGRIMLERSMGKAAFLNIQDQTNSLQLYLNQQETKNYDITKLLDLGDIIGVEGYPFKTKKGELTLFVKELTILTKSLRPLPEKFHGIQDNEIKYRQRYLDLITNTESKETFIKRAQIIKIVRNYLDEQRFIEVETPNLQTTYGGASAQPFKTHMNALNMELFLSISPELFLKRLVVGGYERVYTICKNFRNEDIDTTHNPEFTMLEFYYAYANYEILMKMSEELISKLAKEISGSYKIKELNFKPPFKKITFRDLILKEANIDIEKHKDFESLKKEIIKKELKDIDLKKCSHYGNLMDELYKKVCRPKIIQPTFLTHYPVEMIALAKRNEKDPSKINSFQLIVEGAEIIKAYDELNDPLDQRQRLEEQQKLLKKGDTEAMPLDEDFLEALEIGMPPTAGFGMGIDRLTMMLTQKDSIKDVILFPFMKPKVE